MNQSELLMEVHKDNIDRLLPITSIQTASDKEQHGNDGYGVYYTEPEFKEAFPSIDTTKIFYSPSFTEGILYYDAKKYILFDTFIFSGQVESEADRERIANTILSKIKVFCDWYDKKEFMNMLVAQNGGAMFHLLNNIIIQEPADERVYKLFRDLYSFADYGFDSLRLEAIEKLRTCKSASQNKNTQQVLKSLPETIEIFRGEAEGSLPWQKAYSWTTDINTAYFFALRKGLSNFRIISAKVRKQDVMDAFNERNEHELFCIAENIFDVRELPLPSAPDLMDRSSHVKYYIEAKPDFAFLSNTIQDHDVKHTRRVALLAALICDSQKRLPVKRINQLFQAIAFHDSGRTNNEEDTEHGQNGYRQFCKHYKKDRVVQFLISYHCIDDAEAKAALESNGLKHKDEVWTLYCILKDADALDRVRFGLRGRDSLDINKLRLPYSKTLVAAAEQLFRAKM